MATGTGGSGGGGRHWLAEEAPGFRSDMLQNLTIRLAPFYQPRYEPYSQEAQIIVAKFEEGAFSGTNSKEDYLRSISNKLLSFEKRKSEELQRRMQSRSQLQRTNAPQALQGGNSSVMPEAVMMASPRPPSQPMTPKTSGSVRNQHMAYSCTPDAQIEIERNHPCMMAIMDRCLNFQPSTTIATIGPVVQTGPRPMQCGASQIQIQYPARQPHAINSVGCGPTSESKRAIRPNSQQIHLLGQDDSFIGSQQQQQLTRMNKQTLGVNQQEVDMQRYEILGAQQANASKIQASQLGRRNNHLEARQRDLGCSPFKACKPEPMAPPLQQIGGAQVVNLTDNASPITCVKSRQQKQPSDASILQSRQTTTARTPPTHPHNNRNHLLGIASPSSISSPGTLQSWSNNMLDCLTPSPVAKPVVAPDSLHAPGMSTFSKDVDRISAFLFHDGAAAAEAPKANSSNQVTPTKPTTSASPLQAEIAAGQAEDQARGGEGIPVTKKPIDRLIDAMRSSSPEALRSSANSIWSILSISDIVPHGKIGTILDCKSSQQKQFGGSNTVNKLKRVFNNTASCSESLLSGSIGSSCMSFECDASDSGSSSEISIKRQKTRNANDALLEEIKSVNSTLVDTVISMSGDCGTDRIGSCDGGTTIKLSYSAVSLSPTMKSLFATSETSLVLPMKLFVPADYPSSSPVLISHEGGEVLRKNFSAISVSVDVAFRHVLADLPEPRSIKETARTWDACVRKAVTEFVHRHGGGTVSSMLGRWERCVAA